MSPYCPRCDVEFEKDLARCPGCGWDFRAHLIPDRFLKPPINLDPLREFWRFTSNDIALIWINGLTVQVVGLVAAILIHWLALLALRLLFPDQIAFLSVWVPRVALILALILIFPIWANYLFSLLRRYRYRVPVALFSVFPPRGRSLYAESLRWGLPCLLAGAALTILLVVPGVLCLFVFVPLLLLIHLDKRNLSQRRKAFLLAYTFRRLWLLFLTVGLVLAIIWIAVLALGYLNPLAGLALAALFMPPQAAFAVLLYESLLGRQNLDVD